MMVSHSQLQNYSHHHGAVCMTGLLGCRWHRYKQSTKGSNTRDVVWFIVLLLAFLFILFWFYFVLIAKNDELNLNWYLMEKMGKWLPSYTILLALICVLFSYIFILMLLSLCHILQGHQLYIHPVHLGLIVFVLAVCVAFTVVVQELWLPEWSVIYLSLQVIGPFLQLGAVCLMTFLTWIISQNWFRISKCDRDHVQVDLDAASNREQPVTIPQAKKRQGSMSPCPTKPVRDPSKAGQKEDNKPSKLAKSPNKFKAPKSLGGRKSSESPATRKSSESPATRKSSESPATKKSSGTNEPIPQIEVTFDNDLDPDPVYDNAVAVGDQVYTGCRPRRPSKPKEWKTTCLLTYLLVMIGLYISPLFINSPCVIVASELPRKPKLSAHKGASALAPENTLISFEMAAKYDQVVMFETDIQISLDGVPFLLHDTTLRHTTNVKDVFPDLMNKHPSSFNTTQLGMLSAGQWFLDTDPRGTVSRLSSEEKAEYRNQSIPTLLDFLLVAKQHKKSILFDIKKTPEDHPYYKDMIQIIVDVIGMSDIKHFADIYWINNTASNSTPSYYKTVSPIASSADWLHQHNISGVNLGPDANLDSLRSYKHNNITSLVYMVNTRWLFSFYWCLGVDIVHTDYCHVLSDIDAPIWHLAPNDYLALWVIVDCVSALCIIAIFLCQRSRLHGNRYKPEQSSISSLSNGASWTKRTRRSMKEKLLMKSVQADDIFDFEPEDEFGGIESNGYDITMTATEGRVLSQAFHGNRDSYHSNGTNNRDSFHSNGTITRDNTRDSFHSNGNTNRDSFHSYQGDIADSYCGTSENGSVHSNNRNSCHGNTSTYQTEAEIA